MSNNQHIAIIGAGPGGYTAAFLAADLGFSVTLIDSKINPGGVCLFRGCIPSKALLHVTKVLSQAKDAKDLGIEFSEPKIDLNKIRSWKNSVVTKLTGGLGTLSKHRKINFIQGEASFVDSKSIEILKPGNTKETITFDHVIIATGSMPNTLPFAAKSPKIMDSKDALTLSDIPNKLLVIGGGYIGLELGSVYAKLGSNVDVVEMLPELLTGADRDLVIMLSKRLKSLFGSIKVNTKVTNIKETSSGLEVMLEDKDGKSVSEKYDKVLVAIGRKPNTVDLDLDKANIELTDKGFIKTNDKCQTNVENISAIGDVAGNPLLAHKASHEGRTTIEIIYGKDITFSPSSIPAVVYTDPEIAWCGLTETEAKDKNISVKVEKFPWAASGRAITLNRTDGMTKLIFDPESQKLLGMAIVGVEAGELIAEGALAINMGATVSDIRSTIHPHPTLSETTMEAAESFAGTCTHLYRPKKA